MGSYSGISISLKKHAPSRKNGAYAKSCKKRDIQIIFQMGARKNWAFAKFGGTQKFGQKYEIRKEARHGKIRGTEYSQKNIKNRKNWTFRKFNGTWKFGKNMPVVRPGRPVVLQ